MLKFWLSKKISKMALLLLLLKRPSMRSFGFKDTFFKASGRQLEVQNFHCNASFEDIGCSLKTLTVVVNSSKAFAIDKAVGKRCHPPNRYPNPSKPQKTLENPQKKLGKKQIENP